MNDSLRLLLTFILWGVFSSLIADEYVYVCHQSSSKKYHLRNNCTGLGNCKRGYDAIWHSVAIQQGRTVCLRCYPNGGIPRPSVIPDSTTNNRKPRFIQSPQQSPIYQKPSVDLNKKELPKVRTSDRLLLVEHAAFTALFDSVWQISRWVAYELTKSEVEKENCPRPNKKFEPDPDLPFCKATHADYSHIAPYSRGHMIPARDVKWSDRAMNESFYSTNVFPQHSALNNGLWEKLEDYVRYRAIIDNKVYVCLGVIVPSEYVTVGINNVAIPTYCYKVVCCRHKGKWQAIGFLFPNEECKGDIFSYALSVDEIESLTGYDFFHNFPDSIEKKMEQRINRSDW